MLIFIRPCVKKKSFEFDNVFIAKQKKYKKQRTFLMCKTIKIESTSQTFSSHSGLFLFEEIWKQLKLDKRIKFLLPRKKKNIGPTQLNKFKSLLYSFVVGNDCLADINTSNKDILFAELTGKVAARTQSDFLKSFGNRHAEKLQELLINLSFEIRCKFFAEDKKFILSMDATPHEHYSKKMEGMAWNYKNMWCLDSQNAYDQFGFSYLFDLRPGNTHSGKEAELWVHEVFKRCPAHLEKWFRADSAYGKQEVYKALEAKNVKFAIVLRDNISRYVRKKSLNLLNWKKTEMEFFKSKNCEIAMGHYPIKSVGERRVVFIRAPKSIEDINKDRDLLDDYNPEEHDYRHYSIITNIDECEMDNEEIFEFYRDRATAETYIKEQKYGFDFLNFPCKTLRANKIFGIIGTLAHNLTRILSFSMEQKEKKVRCRKTQEIKKVKQLGYFSKKVRSECINIAGHVVRSARKVKLRINIETKEVLDKIMEYLLLKLSLQT
jgi:phage antirepressor YoqD-like protein